MSLDPQAKCERVQRDNVAYYGHWRVSCVDGALANPYWMGVCYCTPGVDPALWRIELRVDNLNPADPQGDLAFRMAHEFGHAWHAEYGTQQDAYDEAVADTFARQNVRAIPLHPQN